MNLKALKIEFAQFFLKPQSEEIFTRLEKTKNKKSQKLSSQDVTKDQRPKPPPYQMIKISYSMDTSKSFL